MTLVGFFLSRRLRLMSKVPSLGLELVLNPHYKLRCRVDYKVSIKHTLTVTLHFLIPRPVLRSHVFVQRSRHGLHNHMHLLGGIYIASDYLMQTGMDLDTDYDDSGCTFIILCIDAFVFVFYSFCFTN